MTRVLIVEDEPGLADPLAYLLRREGFEAEIAEDGPTALDLFSSRGADIVLLDLMLPGMPGTEVCRVIRASSRVPIIMLTAKDSEVDDHIVEGGRVRLDLDRHTVSVDGREISMPLKEYELLELLMRNAGRVLTRGQLIDRVWGSDYFGDTKTLDVHIKRIRSRIEENPREPQMLLTVRGLGYRFEG